MLNFTEAHKVALQQLVEAGTQVATVIYNPALVLGDPEGDALAAGWTEYYRESTAAIVEVIYTRG